MKNLENLADMHCGRGVTNNFSLILTPDGAITEPSAGGIFLNVNPFGTGWGMVRVIHKEGVLLFAK